MMTFEEVNGAKTQLQMIRIILLNHETITSMQAFGLGITRLSSIIHKLRTIHGLSIHTEMILNGGKGNGYAKYRLG